VIINRFLTPGVQGSHSEISKKKQIVHEKKNIDVPKKTEMQTDINANT